MNRILSAAFICLGSLTFAQIGIGTNTPAASAQLEINSNSKGMLFPRMSSVQRANIASPATGLYVWDTNTNSLWYFNGTLWINTVSEASYGDVKSGFQAADHAGWILLDGRAVNTLNASQQAIALSLGFTTNLPDASTSYLVQNGTGLGSVTGSNTVVLTQGNLPNVNFTGNAANAGSHNHTTDPAAFTSANAGNHAHDTDPTAVNTTTNGWHNHGSNANGGSLGLAYSDCNGTASSTDYSCNELNVWVAPQALSIYGDGNHAHTVDVPNTTSTTTGDHNHSIDVPSTTSTTAPDHSHTVTVASGGTANPVNIAPKSLSVNMFVYLGQ